MNSFYTVPKAAILIGRTPMTIYRWVEAKKIHALNYSGIIFIPGSEIERCRLKLCKTCYHHVNSHCACREVVDVIEGCSDWFPKEG